MFVKQAYQKRLKKQEDQINNMMSLKRNKQPKIGSIRNDKINYDRQQQFFSKEDVPFKAKTVKEQVKHLIDPDHLGLRKRQWNGSVSVPKNWQLEQTHQRKLLKIKLGFMDHPLPKWKQPINYSGTQTRNDYTNWNVSTQVIPRDVKQNLLKNTLSAFDNSKLKEQQLLNNYLTPFNKTGTLIQSSKKKWREQQQLRQALKQKYMFENPDASQQKINAAIFRLAYQTQVKQKKDNIQAQAMKTDFKATLCGTQKAKISLKCHHNGVWQKFSGNSGQEQDDYYAWSCCMNEDQNSPGCVQKLKDGNRWNFSSFNNN